MKAKIQKATLSLGLIAMLTSPLMALAQRSQIGVGGIGNQVQVSPGTYERIDITAPEFANLFRQMNADDSAWIKETVNQVNTARQTLKTHLIELTKLANDSMQKPTGIELSEYLAKSAPIRIELAALKNSIDVVTAVPSARNANNVAKLESGKMTILANGAMQSINIAPIKTVFDKFWDDTMAQVNSLVFYIHALNPPPGSGPRIEQRLGEGLNPVLTKNFTPEQINQLTIDADKREKNSRLALTIELERARRTMKNLLQTAIDEYGIKDRFQIRKLDDAGLETVKASIENMYLAQSVLRYYYAVPIGAFGTPDTRRLFSFQQVPLANSNNLVISDGVVLSQAELVAARRWIVVALNTQKDWAGENSSTWMDKIKNPLSTISNLVNFVAFREGWSKINAFVLKQMLIEIEEELALPEPGGLLKVKTDLKARINASPTAKAKVAEILAVIDSADGKVASNSAIGAGGTNDQMRTMGSAIQRYLTDYNYANSLRRQAADLRQQSDGFSADRKQRGQDLLN